VLVLVGTALEGCVARCFGLTFVRPLASVGEYVLLKTLLRNESPGGLAHRVGFFVLRG